MPTTIVHKKASYALLLLFVLYFMYTIFYMSYGKDKEPKKKNIATTVAQTPIAQKSFFIYTSCIRQNWGLFTPLVHHNAEVYLYVKDTISKRVIDSVGMISFFAKRKTNAWFLSSTHEAYEHLFYNCTYTFLKRYHYYKMEFTVINLEADSMAAFQLRNIKAFIPIVLKQKYIITMHKQFKLQFTYLPIAPMGTKEEMAKPEILYSTSYFNL